MKYILMLALRKFSLDALELTLLNFVDSTPFCGLHLNAPLIAIFLSNTCLNVLSHFGFFRYVSKSCSSHQMAPSVLSSGLRSYRQTVLE